MEIVSGTQVNVLLMGLQGFFFFLTPFTLWHSQSNKSGLYKIQVIGEGTKKKAEI